MIDIEAVFLFGHIHLHLGPGKFRGHLYKVMYYYNIEVSKRGLEMKKY